MEVIYKGKKYSLRTVEANKALCPGCAFDKDPNSFCTKFKDDQTAIEKEMATGCWTDTKYGLTPIWERITYPWYEKLWNWVTRKK